MNALKILISCKINISQLILLDILELNGINTVYEIRFKFYRKKYTEAKTAAQLDYGKAIGRGWDERSPFRAYRTGGKRSFSICYLPSFKRTGRIN